MLWLLACVTTAAVLIIAGFVKEISKTPVVARPAALTATARPTPHATPSTSARRTPSASPSRRTPSASASRKTPKIADASSGLSYRLLSSPWRQGCPGTLDSTPMFSWTAGENAVAGRASVDGMVTNWYGNACSGLLQQQFTYSSTADLDPVAVGLTDALDPAYYSGLRHYRTIQSSSAMQVSGHQAWVIQFQMTYPDAARQGLAWSSETGAVVVVDRGPSQEPAVFYASVPSDLGTSAISTLVGSLRLSPE
jgi:hypothetical protein